MRNAYLIGTIAILLFMALPALAEGPVEHFPCPPKMKASIDFWKRIYTEVSNGEGVLHDRENLGIVYEVFAPPPEESVCRKKEITSRVGYYELQLRRLASDPDTQEPSLRKIASLWEGMNPDAQTYLAASQRVRFQRGQRENFLAGLRRSAEYLPYMRSILKREGVPQELVYLPHVESSFNCQARSKAGAVGMWQFLRGTGKKYLTINKHVDERKDPLLSTRAAARLLRDNYEKLGSWPLALIAYNYGTNGMLRATEEHNTTDFEYILDNHKQKAFRFASKNFYAEFLAAKEIAENPDHFFEEMRIAENGSREEVTCLEDTSGMTRYADAADKGNDSSGSVRD